MSFRIPIGLTLAAGTALLVSTGARPAPSADAAARLLVIGETGGTFTSQFNPTSFLVEKDVPWQTQPGAVEPPDVTFQFPHPSLLTTTLNFDTDQSGQDVADLVGPLEGLATISPSLHRPPMVTVQFGTFSFKGVIVSYSVKYSQFQADGTKGRAVVKLAVQGASAASVRPPT